MRIFATRVFGRLDVAVEVGVAELIAAVVEMNSGLWDANLGSQLYKKRVGLKGRGKRGGARTLVAFRRHDRAFFICGFSKNQRATITPRERQTLKRLANELLGYSDQSLQQALDHGAIIELRKRKHE